MSAAEPLPVDPFCSAGDPARYVPRVATEQALAELRAVLAGSPGKAIAFVGPPGIGKSLLLHVLAAQAASDYTFVCLQATPPGAEQVCESALYALGDGSASDPVGALGLRAELLARRGRPLVLLLDSVEALAPQALAEVAALASDSLRVVLVASERDDSDCALDALDPALPRVRLSAPLSRAETEDYLRSRLEAADAPPELRVKLLATALDLWRRSRGNPQCLHAEISQVQLELWRTGEAEPRLCLLPAEPEPAVPAPSPQLGALEVGADLEPVAAEPVEAEPVATREALPPTELVLPQDPGAARTAGRSGWFVLGALSGALATAALMLALGSFRERPVAPVRAALEPELPPVAAAPPPQPAVELPTRPPPPEVENEPPPVRPEPEVAAKSAPGPEPERARAGPRAPAGPVRVNVQALPWATIYVDGVLAGETPLGDLAVAPGLREFRAEMPDGRKLVKRVQVQAGMRVLFQ